MVSQSGIDMIAKQRTNRREKHLKAIETYEHWEIQLEETLSISKED